MKSYQLHSAPERHAVFAELAPPIWREDDVLSMWVVADPSVIRQILRHPQAEFLDLGQILAAVKSRFDIELANMEYACCILPVLVRADIHASVRRQFAAFLSGRLGEIDAQLQGIVKSSLAPLRRKGRVDVIAQVANPLMRRVFSILLGTEMPETLLSLHVVEILSFKATVSHLKKLDSRIGTVLSYLRATTADEQEVGWKLTCLVFGLHTLAMMIVEGLVMALRQSDGTGQAARLSDFPIETGVPVSHRRARTDFEIAGYKFEAGALIRLQMQALGYSPSDDDHKYIFGAGAHACLGKHLSLRIWDAFRHEFDAIGLKARIIDYRLSPSHYIIFHESVELEVL